MARGWESKSVEDQQAERENATRTPTRMSAAEIAKAAARRTLELSRARAAADLARATIPAHRAMLEAAIRALDAQLDPTAE